MIQIRIDKNDIAALKAELKDKANRLPREVATAINATAKKVRLEVARLIGKDFTPPISILKKVMKQKSKASKTSMTARLAIGKGYPFPLKYLRARQGKKGVTFKPYKSGGTNFRVNAFVAKNWGKNVYQRQDGSRRLVKLFGPSPGEAAAKLNVRQFATRLAKQELPKQIQRRIRFLQLKSSGGLRGNQR